MSSLLTPSRGLSGTLKPQERPVARLQGPSSRGLTAPTAPFPPALWTAAGRQRKAAAVAAAAARRPQQQPGGEKEEDGLQDWKATRVQGVSGVFGPARLKGLADVLGVPLKLAQDAVASQPRITWKTNEKIAADSAETRAILSRSTNPSWRHWATAPITTPPQLIERAKISPNLNERLRLLIDLGLDVAIASPSHPVRWTAAAWEEKKEVIALYGKDGLRRLVAGEPAAFSQPLAKHQAVITALQEGLAINKAAAVKLILSHPVVLTYPPALLKRCIKQAVLRTGSQAAALDLFQGNPDLMFKAEELEAATGGKRRTGISGPIRSEPSLRNAAILGISEERFRSILGNARTGIAGFPPELLESRIQGLAALLDCPREVVASAAVLKPGILSSETGTLAKKINAIKTSISRCKNPEWHAWSEAPITSAKGVLVRTAVSLERIGRLDWLVRTGKDEGAPSPGAVLKMSENDFNARFGGGEE